MMLLGHSLYSKAHITVFTHFSEKKDSTGSPRRVQLSQLFVYKPKMGAETLQTESEITKKSLFSPLLSNSIIAAANLLKKKWGTSSHFSTWTKTGR